MSDEINNKLGMAIMIFIAVLVGLILLQASAVSVGEVTNTISVVNQSITTAANGLAVNLQGREVSDVIIRNSSVLFNTVNYSTLNNRIVNGAFGTAQLQTDNAFMASQSVNASYTYEPFGYIDDSGGRSVASLILIFFALIILIVSILPAIKERWFD